MTVTRKNSYLFTTILLLIALLAIPTLIHDIAIKRVLQVSILFIMSLAVFLLLWENYKSKEKINYFYLIGIILYGVILYFTILYLKK